jgi:AcrR family transcriptional regulator
MNTDRKSQILRAAAILIKEKGYDGTSMRDLASTIPMEASSLYNHISSKDQILKLICFDMAEKFEKGLAEVNDIYFNAEEKLHLAVKNHIIILAQNPYKAYVFINEWRKLDATSLQEFINLRDNY